MTDKTAKASANRKVPGKWITLWAAAAILLLAICILFIYIGGGAQPFPVVISEILASNTGYPNAAGKICDYIEIHNTANHALDLTGFRLGDLAGENRYLFPAGTILEADEYFVIWCESESKDPEYAPFGISRSGGEEFCLITKNNAIADRVTTVAVGLDEAMARLEDGTWGLTEHPTPGAANDTYVEAIRDFYNPDVSSVRISEYSSAENGYCAEIQLRCDWVELHNTDDEPADLSGYTLSDNAGNDKYAVPAGTVLPGDGYLVIFCDADADGGTVAPFMLDADGGETLVLKTPDGKVVEFLDTQRMENGSCAYFADGWEITQKLSPGYENTENGYTAFLTGIGADVGRITISEVMSGEQYILDNGMNGFSDWVELCNNGDVPVELGCWSLSDDPAEPDKWMFPELVLDAGERTVIFCSGSGAAADGVICADFGLSASGETLVLSSSAGTQTDLVTLGQAETDHSFAAAGNGEMVLTDKPTPGYSNDENGYEAFCASGTAKGPLAIWEVMTANTEYLPQALGECYDWVELCNVSDASLCLSDYAISDDAANPGMHILPDVMLAPGQTICIILSGEPQLSTERYDHAAFALNGAKDRLLLYGTDGTLVDYVALGKIPIGMSYGRSAASGGFYYMIPTPNRPNEDGTRLISAAPVSEIQPGVYTGEDAFVVPFEAAGTVYYTTDGSDPGPDDILYEGPVTVAETTVLRAAAIEDGKLVSEIWTSTFVIQEPHSIPVVSLVTDPVNLWGGKGIYQNFIEIKEERRDANISYSGEDGSFSIGCEISLHGATTVTAFDKKSFTLRFKNSYDGPLYYDLFGDGEVTVFSSLILRAAHESTQSSHMHDILIADFSAENCDTVLSQKYRYVALYLNGEYWGLYALREHHSREHYASYMHVPADTVMMQRFATDTRDGLMDLYNYCKENDLSDDTCYAYVESQMDMSSMVDWMIMEAYMSNFDINGNMRYYYSPIDGKWRCGLVDVDLGMFGYSAFDEVAGTFHHSVFTANLMKNEAFQELLAARLAELLEGPLSDGNMCASIDNIAAIIRDEMPMECDRWGYDVYVWESFVAGMKHFCTGRSDIMIESLCNELGFTAKEREAWFGHLAEA